MNLDLIFSEKRLSSYRNKAEHKNNFILIKKICDKLGLIEIVTRNKVFNVLKDENKLFILERVTENTIIDYDDFISHQTFGFWAKIIALARIQNQILDLSNLDFRKYSKYNRKIRFQNYYKVLIAYDLLVKIRNRAFHFENLYKLNNGRPRISTNRCRKIIGIMPNEIENFLNDILENLEEGLSHYLESGG